MSFKNEKTAGAVAILEHFTRDNPVHERNASKRVFADVVRAWPGDIGRLWWKWLTEASISLGMRTKTLDCSLEEAYELAGSKARFVCFRDDTSASGVEWFSVVASSRKRYQVLIANDHDEVKNLSERALRKELKRFANDGRIRCVVIQPRETAASSEDETGHREKLTPISRLWKLLRPERSDIWLVVIFAFVVSLLMLATPMAVEAMVNTVAFGRLLQPIIILSIILLTFLGFQGAVRALQTYVVEIIQQRLFARVAGDLAYRLPRTEREASDEEYLPEVVNRFFDIVTVQKVAAGLLLDGIGLILSTFVGMAVLGFYHPWLLGFDLFLLSAIAIIIFVLGRGAIASAIKESKHKYYMAAWLEDVARCPTAFRNAGGADFALERTDRLVHQYLTARQNHFRILMRQILFALGLQAVASTVLLGLGGWLVISEDLTLGQLVAAELIVTVIVGSFAKFGKHMESFYDLLASVDKLGVLFDLPTERQDGILALETAGPANVEMNMVSYGWATSPKVIESVSAQIESGDRIVVFGGAGTGKSTLLDLIAGQRCPTSGQLTLDDFDPRDLRPDLLKSRVALARGDEIFHSTVEENVHMHREGITTINVRDVLKSLGLLDCVLRLKNGSDTMLTSAGAPLSDEQRRLLGVARAVVGKPGLLLIDSSLDSLAEEEIDVCLSYLMDPEQPWTLIVATSRWDIAERFQKIINMGPNAQLINKAFTT